MSGGPPPLVTEHVCRISALEKEKTWTLRGDVLWVRETGGAEGGIALASLREVRLVFSPTRVQRNRYQCHLFNAGGRCAAFQNEHYRGLMDFEDRSGSYRDLVELLVKRTASVNPGCRFATGTSWWSWGLQTAFLAGVLVVLAAVLFLMWSAVGWLAIVKLLIILYYIPTAWAWVMKNKPRKFDPGKVPGELLPG